MKILMVCLGNICRSPMAQGIMEKCIVDHQLDWSVDSAGTNGFHNGEHPDPRAIKESRIHNIDISKQVSRQIQFQDFENFDLILAMDLNNYNDLKSLCSNSKQISKIYLLMDFVFPGQNQIVPDPYYDNRFDLVFKLIYKACDSLILTYKSGSFTIPKNRAMNSFKKLKNKST